MKQTKSEILLYILINLAIMCLVALSVLGLHEALKRSNTEIVTPKKEMIVKTEYKNFPSKYIGTFSVTHYCSCPKCTGTGEGSRTATGIKPREGRTIAVDKRIIPLHSIVYVEDLGYFVAEDVGGGVKGNHIDIFVNNHERAIQLGTLNGKKFKVFIMKEIE